MVDLFKTLAPYRKWLVYVVAVASALLTAGLLPASVAAIVSSVIAALGALGIYAVPNRPLVPSGPGAAMGADGMGQEPEALTPA